MALMKNRLVRKYSTIPNKIITDNNLSNGAKIVFCYLASKPDNWEVNNNDIKNQLNINSNNTIAKYLKELIQNGWINRTYKTNGKGKFIGGFDYELIEDNEIALFENTQNCENAKTDKHNKTELPNKTEDNNKNIKKETEFIENKELREANFVSEYLLSKIKSIKPNFICKNINTWNKDLILAITKDNRTKQELINCIDYIYSPKGKFWQGIILSGKKLREKFDQLEMQFLANNSSYNKDKIKAILEAERMGAL